MLNLRQNVVLGSKSPRRSELLAKMGIDFTIISEDVNESFSDQMPVRNIAEYLSQEKNKAYRNLIDSEILITADTTVIVDDCILNKPQDKGEAVSFLRKLSDSTHSVITGVTVSDRNDIVSFSSETMVRMEKLTIEEIQHYVTTYEPYDKAGAYGIQEWIGLIGISSIEGSYFNVMGLPTKALYSTLKKYFVSK